MNLIIWFLRFVMGWILFIIILILSLFYSLIFWNWKETFTLDMKVVISEIAGKTVWNDMTFTTD
jgi:hypothetical protein